MKKIDLNVKHYIQEINTEEYNNNDFLKNNYSLEELNLNICGLTCLQMCIQYYKGFKENLATLTEKAIKSEILKLGIGCIHYKLIELAREYNLEGCLIKEERQDRLLTLLNFMLSNNHLVIASVTPGILKDNNKPKGGHLVLIKGIDEKNLIINDPDNIKYFVTESNKIVDIDRFMMNFSGNIICISDVN